MNLSFGIIKFYLLSLLSRCDGFTGQATTVSLFLHYVPSIRILLVLNDLLVSLADFFHLLLTQLGRFSYGLGTSEGVFRIPYKGDDLN